MNEQDENEDIIFDQGEIMVKQLQKYLNSKIQEIPDGKSRLNELYEECLEEYQMGFISWESIDLSNIPDEQSDIYKIEIKDEYVVISIAYISMMICDEDVEEFLAENWVKIRKSLMRHNQVAEFKFLRDLGLGIKLYAFAGIGGYGYHGRSAIVYTPEQIKDWKI